MDRRTFFELMSAALAAAGCGSRPGDKIVPYVTQPRDVQPGRSIAFATSMSIAGEAVGLLVESRDGRPIKVEGHPQHPSSLGAAGLFAQASILGLYDVDRGREIRERGRPKSWKDLVDVFGPSDPARPGGRYGNGRGLHFLLEPTSSPSIGAQLAEIERRFPDARLHFHTPFGPERRWAGAALCFGRPLEVHPDLSLARVVAALDADFLGHCRLGVQHARAFVDGRRVRSTADDMNRLYAVETSLSLTGAAADHRLALPPSEIPSFGLELFAELLAILPAGLVAELPPALVEGLRALRARAAGSDFVRVLAQDLADNPSASLVLVGDQQPPALHALAHAMNELLGNAGATVRYADPLLYTSPTSSFGLEQLVSALDRGEVQTLVVVEGNPLYTAPAGLELARRVSRVERSLYLGAYENETAAACRWFVPAAHYLESWGDSQAENGTVSLTQPLIEPLFGGRTALELLAVFLGVTEPNGRELLERFWQDNGVSGQAWEQAVQRGLIDAPLPLSVPAVDFARLAPELESLLAPKSQRLELWVRPDDKVYDGRFANNSWLQELPDPISKLSWDNAALVSPRTASRLGLSTGDLVTIRAGKRAVEAPVLVSPGHADGAVTLSFGYGRSGSESVARGVGVNAALLLDKGAFTAAIELEPLGRSRALVIAQPETSAEGRHVAIARTLQEFRGDPETEPRHQLPMLYFRAPGGAQQWAMSIDLSACTGCSACVVACQAENNVPVVGREWMLRRRQMHWIRIDRYLEGPEHDPRVVLQPMLCQHCERAPCEYVCPVNATTHSPDGLNEMTYNRCVGTRFCSNNCPYKVRRFNYLDYTPDQGGLEVLVKNPDVTVRDRGVMEKCTYCVQRIRKAEIEAIVENRRIRGDEVVTACAQTCPTRAIVFGSISDPDSEVSRQRREPRRYDALGELGTRPRTTYLARLVNPNLELERVRNGGA